MPTRIADEYSYIAKRLAQIQQDRTTARFTLPENVLIIVTAERIPTNLPANDLCLLLNIARQRLTVAAITPKWRNRDFYDYLKRYFPSLQVVGPNEMHLSPEDTIRLAEYVRR